MKHETSDLASDPGAPGAAGVPLQLQPEAERAPAVLAVRERLAYGLGDFASGLYWHAFTAYLAFFYTDVFGLSALAAGTLLGTSRSVDALFDPLIGGLADRTSSRWGKFRPYLLWLSVPLAVAGVLAFTVPEGGATLRLVWAWATFNLLMLLYTGVSIPYTALLAVLTPNPAQRTALASIKFVFSFSAGLLVTAGVLPACRALGGDDVASGWQRCFMLLGALAVLCFLITFAGTRERVPSAPQPTMNLRRELGDLLGNRPWLILFAFSLLLNLCVAVRNAVAVHHLKYYVGEQTSNLPSWLPWLGGPRTWHLEELSAAFSTAGGVAAVAGVVCVPALARAAGRKPALLGLSAVALATIVGVYWVRPEQLGALMGITLIGSFVGAPISPLLWSMYADTVDYAEWKTGRRATGLVFAMVIFGSKQGWALGAILSLGLLSTLGFVANTTQSAESLHGLLLLMSLIPAAIFALGVIVVAFYPLDERRVAQIGHELTARRAAAGEPPAA